MDDNEKAGSKRNADFPGWVPVSGYGRLRRQGTGSGGDQSGGGDKITIKLNTSWGENSSVQEGALKFAELLDEASGGRFEVTVYPQNQLASGNQQTAVEMVQTGDIEASLVGMTVLSYMDDRLAVVNMPFLIPTYEDADTLLFDPEAEGRQLLDQALEENGMISWLSVRPVSVRSPTAAMRSAHRRTCPASSCASCPPAPCSSTCMRLWAPTPPP